MALGNNDAISRAARALSSYQARKGVPDEANLKEVQERELKHLAKRDYLAMRLRYENGDLGVTAGMLMRHPGNPFDGQGGASELDNPDFGTW